MALHMCQSWSSALQPRCGWVDGCPQETVTCVCPGTAGSIGLHGNLSCLHLHGQQHLSGAASIALGCSRGGSRQHQPRGHLPLAPPYRSTPQHAPLLLSFLPAFHPVSPVCHNPFSVCSPSLSWHANLINTLSVSPCWLLMGVLNSGFPAPQ